MGWRRLLLIGTGVVALAVGIAWLLWEPATTVEIEATGPPGLSVRCDYTVDGVTGTITGPVPCTVTIRGRDILYRISKEGHGGLRFQTTTDGETGAAYTLETPGGSQRVYLPARRFWMGRGKTYATTAD